MSDVSAALDQMLAERRPDRYEVDGGDDWLDLIADEIAGMISPAEGKAIAARQMVRRREGEKTKTANRLLREIYESGEMPLDWMDVLSLPVVVGKERVAIRAATSEDFRLFATDERRRAATDFTTRNLTCEAAEWLANLMDSRGFRFGRDIELS